MSSKELSDQLILLSKSDIVEFIKTYHNQIRYLFLITDINSDSVSIYSQMLLTLATKNFSQEEIATIQLQSFYTHLAHFFKKANRKEFIDTCYEEINESAFKKRLDAWYQYKKYHNYESHIIQFESYIKKLSEVIDEMDGHYVYEVFADLREYHEYVNKYLPSEYITKLGALFNNPVLHQKYPLLEQYLYETSEIPDLNISQYTEKEYEPTRFSNIVFNENFMNYVKEKSFHGYPKMLMGYEKDTIVNEVIKRGQANFDESYKLLTSEDIVKLYCYFNMRKHFFTSLSLYERSNILDKYYATDGRIKFIDIGCGPATCGLAFTEYIHQATNEKVSFDYLGIDSSKAMRDQANKMMTNTEYAGNNNKQFIENITEINVEFYQNAKCILINCCYVFASSSLPYREIAGYINKLKIDFPFTPRYLLFQNSPIDALNKTYNAFKALLNGYDEEFVKKETIFYHTQTSSYWEAKKEKVYYEILKL